MPVVFGRGFSGPPAGSSRGRLTRARARAELAGFGSFERPHGAVRDRTGRAMLPGLSATRSICTFPNVCRTMTVAETAATPPPAKVAKIAQAGEFRVKRLSESAVLPKRGSAGAAGYDLSRSERGFGIAARVMRRPASGRHSRNGQRAAQEMRGREEPGEGGGAGV